MLNITKKEGLNYKINNVTYITKSIMLTIVINLVLVLKI
jgi:hypothetical protein